MAGSRSPQSPNTSAENRVAFGIGITHRDADLRHYYLLPGQERPLIEGFRVEPEFFFRYNNASLSAMHDRGEKPKGLTSLGVFAMHNPQVETGLLTQRIEAAGTRNQHSRVFELFLPFFTPTWNQQLPRGPFPVSIS